jgi:light-regulated signal transduction histidine kinase (bacteriophytochrome)
MTTVDLKYNKLLLKQIQKKFSNIEDLPPEVLELLSTVSHTYDFYERERQLIERSMDISSNELIEANSKLEEQAQKLKRSNEELREFAFAVSHDLREPLRTIASYIQLVELRLKDHVNSETKEFMDFAVSGVKRLQNMLEGMLKYAQVEEGQKDFNRQDLNIILEMVIDNLQDSIATTKAAVKIEPTMPVVNGNRIQLIQLFQQLISNSLKFKHEEATIVTIRVEGRQNDFLFSVCDNGIGVQESDKGKLFSLFKSGHSGKYDGIGMGLSICKKIVENHNGAIWIDEETIKGTKILFTLPKSNFA